MSGVTALCIGDVHIQTSNISRLNEFFTKLNNLITTNDDIDIIILMGDILHTHERLHTVSFNYATNLFTMLSGLKPTYVLVGNHDLINNSQFLTSNHWMNCFKTYKNLTIIDSVVVVEKNGVKFTLCPYVPDGKFLIALDTQKGKWEDSNCIFAHQLFTGAKMGAIVAEDIEKWNESFPQIISGHIHDKQKIQSNLYYTGSSIQHAFGESADKTILKLVISNIGNIYNEIDLDLPKKKILYMEMEELETFDHSTLDTNTEYKLTIDGSYEEFEGFKKTSKYKDILKRGIKIVFKHKKSFILEKKNQLKDVINKPQSKSFYKILNELVSKEDNPFLDSLLSEIVLNQKKSEDLIIIEEDDEIVETTS